jgi:glyoxylase-like metal-dependent hydrolase (beta-lactamase superfamily II)
MWLRLIAAIATIALILAVAGYFLVVDGRLPENPDYKLDLAELRALADADPSQRPYAVEVEIVAREEIPAVAAQAGLDRSPLVMARTVFRLKSDWGDTLIDVGMDRTIAKRFNTGARYEDDAFERIRAAIGDARRIVVTHEHPDHIGYLVRYPNLRAIASNLRLTREQIDGAAIYTDDGLPPAALRDISPVPTDTYTLVAPGVLMIPAPGHTPGSVMYFVKLADGREALFVGDVVWNMSNINDQHGRPRLVQYFLMQTREDRDRVYNQLAAIIDMSRSNPDLIIIPSHDEARIRALIDEGLLVHGFARQPASVLAHE